MDELYDQHEVAEAERFADILDTLEAGGQPDFAALFDSELAALLRTADTIREPGMLATESAAFRSYHARSRAYLLHTLEQQRRPVPQPAASRPGQVQHAGILAFITRHRRWAAFAPAAAAAAVGLMLFSPLALAPGDDRPSVAANLTSARADAELDRISRSLAELTARSTRGEPVNASLLRAITESTTAVANRIETQPQSVSKEHVKHYQHAAAQSSTILNAIQPTAGMEDALVAAQRATQDSMVTAARFLGVEPTATPSATPTAAPQAEGKLAP